MGRGPIKILMVSKFIQNVKKIGAWISLKQIMINKKIVKISKIYNVIMQEFSFCYEFYVHGQKLLELLCVWHFQSYWEGQCFRWVENRRAFLEFRFFRSVSWSDKIQTVNTLCKENLNLKGFDFRQLFLRNTDSLLSWDRKHQSTSGCVLCSLPKLENRISLAFDISKLICRPFYTTVCLFLPVVFV